jgi:uncharacterized pyridoxamine 5'-phosphate oxidase family protein
MDDEQKRRKMFEGPSKLLAEYRVKELMDKPKEVLAEYSMKLEHGVEKQERMIDSLTVEVERLKKKITDMQNAQLPSYKYQGYNKKDSWLEKIRFIITRNAALMNSSEIKNALLLLEPDLKERWANPDNYVSQVLYLASKHQAIARTKKYGVYGHYWYGIPEWYNEEGKFLLTDQNDNTIHKKSFPSS